MRCWTDAALGQSGLMSTGCTVARLATDLLREVTSPLENLHRT
ncbi:hypothetical protein RI103_14150 [Paraburkholderia sp. FT54]|nr:hypothetical protein [Paraburkholderia sp. FT54]WNC88839.1 hypothetical protein RI103_14150 [Paraburkholderia sp. FT54]